MKKVLILFSSSYPFGEGETFLANEMPYLVEAFDQIFIISNDTESEQIHPLPPGARCLRLGYALSAGERRLALTGLAQPRVWREIREARRRSGIQLSRRVLATILASWFKAQKFAQLIRQIAQQNSGGKVFGYAFWADDMALAVAMARKRGWVEKAACRAHGWDVYPGRSPAGFLPFRELLARHLDHYRFVSHDGLRVARQQLESVSYPSMGVSRLGVPGMAQEPLGRPKPFTVLSCSNLIPLKRVDRIPRALALLSEPTLWIHLGDGPERDRVEEACRSLPDHVEARLMGHLPHGEIPEVYRRLQPTVLLNLSAWEGLPVTMMEAMAAGVPVVGTDVGGVREIVRAGENGLLLSPDPTPEEVARALTTVSALSEEAYRTYAFQAWDSWRREFDARVTYPAFLEMIME